ncbi:hypothetical protein HYU07_04695 [Candidatus Woesearchaeota archaeon]|nr:hypothetical protein [Candidatus Woesearchaeota archaeon]
MAIDERLLAEFIPSEEKLTELETQPGFPLPIDTTIILVGESWPFLKKLIRQSYNIIKDVFEGTSLEYKLSLYKESMPAEEEAAMDFLKRNRQKFGIKGDYDDLMGGITNAPFIMKEGRKITLESINRFSARMYTGEKPTMIDSYNKKEVGFEKEKIKRYDDRTRKVFLQEKYEIEFEVGFKQDGDGKKLWFYSFGYRTTEFSQLYEKLYKSIVRSEDLLCFKKDRVEHEKFGIIRFLT